MSLNLYVSSITKTKIIFKLLTKIIRYFNYNL